MSYEEDEKKELDSGVWFQSSVSGLWYKNRYAVGDVSQVRVDGAFFTPTPAWQQLQDELRQGREAVEKLQWATNFLKRLQIEINTSEDPLEQAEDYFGNWDDLVNERESELVELRNLIKEQRESK